MSARILSATSAIISGRRPPIDNGLYPAARARFRPEGLVRADLTTRSQSIVTWNQPTIDQLFSMGYPTAGAFSQAQLGLGHVQYLCQTVWSPQSDSLVDAASFGKYFGLVVQPCAETGGASGGPVFTDANGRWTIVGFNNRGPAPDARGFGVFMLSFYFNHTFGSLWRSVIQQVNEGI